jgi:HEAT repeat protein
MAFVKYHPFQTSAVVERHRPRDFPGLLAALDDEDPIARHWAAYSLAVFAESGEALVRRLQCETIPAVQEAILMALSHLADPATLTGLVECLRSNDALRHQVTETMRALPDKVAPLICGLLNAPDPDVRIFAIGVLESLRHPDIEAWLIDVITRDPHAPVCAAALDLLGEIGSPASHRALARVKARFPSDLCICFIADLALERMAPHTRGCTH